MRNTRRLSAMFDNHLHWENAFRYNLPYWNGESLFQSALWKWRSFMPMIWLFSNTQAVIELMLRTLNEIFSFRRHLLRCVILWNIFPSCKNFDSIFLVFIFISIFLAKKIFFIFPHKHLHFISKLNRNRNFSSPHKNVHKKLYKVSTC